MSEPKTFYSFTIKIYKNALIEAIRYIKALKLDAKSNLLKEELVGLEEKYDDILKKVKNARVAETSISRNWDMFYLSLPESVHTELASLVKWQLNNIENEIKKIATKEYLTENDERKLNKLKNTKESIEVSFSGSTSVLNKNKDINPYNFSHFIDTETTKEVITQNNFIPDEVINILDQDLKILCEELNFCVQNNKPYASLLLLRRILPFAIVRKFQKEGRESDIKLGLEFLQTKQLMEKGLTCTYIPNNLYKDLIVRKYVIDSSQHSYKISVSMTDVINVGIVLRLLLDELFK